MGLGELRSLRLSYWGFDHAVHQGELIVNASAAASLTQAFRLLFAGGFPIRLMRAVDDFGGDDERSMLADNTSAFNCRLVPRHHRLGTARLRPGGRHQPVREPGNPER